MKNLNQYVIEKFKINKNSVVPENSDLIAFVELIKEMFNNIIKDDESYINVIQTTLSRKPIKCYQIDVRYITSTLTGKKNWNKYLDKFEKNLNCDWTIFGNYIRVKSNDNPDELWFEFVLNEQERIQYINIPFFPKEFKTLLLSK